MKTGVAPLLVPSRAGQSCREGAQSQIQGSKSLHGSKARLQEGAGGCIRASGGSWKPGIFSPAPPCVAALFGAGWKSLLVVQFPAANLPCAPRAPHSLPPFSTSHLGSRLPRRGCLWKGCGSAVFACKVSCLSGVSLPLLIPRASRGSGRFLLPAQCHVDVPSVTSRTWGFRMCLKNQLHHFGWVFDLVCSYLGLIYELFRGDEISVGFSGVE